MDILLWVHMQVLRWLLRHGIVTQGESSVLRYWHKEFPFLRWNEIAMLTLAGWLWKFRRWLNQKDENVDGYFHLSVDDWREIGDKIINNEYGSHIKRAYLEFADPTADPDVWYTNSRFYIEQLVLEKIVPQPPEPEFEY